MKKKKLVVVAYSNDGVLGCEEPIAKAIEEGAEVHVSFWGEVISARFPIAENDSKEYFGQTKIRQNSAKRALAALKIKNF